MTLAVLHGHSIGGGLQLGLACDLRLATEDAVLGLGASRHGIIPDGGVLRFARLVGLGRAKELALLNDDISPAEARAIGLVNWVCAPAEVEATVAGLVERLRHQAPTANAHIKRLLHESFHQDPRAMIEEVMTAQRDCMTSWETIEANRPGGRSAKPRFIRDRQGRELSRRHRRHPRNARSHEGVPRLRGGPPGEPARAAWHHPRAHRTQRRRQDHLLQPAHQLPRPHRRSHRVQGARRHGPAPGRHRAPGAGAVVPDLGGVPASERAGERAPGAASGGGGARSTSGARSASSTASTSRRSGCWRRSASEASRPRRPSSCPTGASARWRSPPRWRSIPS